MFYSNYFSWSIPKIIPNIIEKQSPDPPKEIVQINQVWFDMVNYFNCDNSFYSWKYKSLVIVSRKYYNLVNIRFQKFIIKDKQKWICSFFYKEFKSTSVAGTVLYGE